MAINAYTASLRIQFQNGTLKSSNFEVAKPKTGILTSAMKEDQTDVEELRGLIWVKRKNDPKSPPDQTSNHHRVPRRKFLHFSHWGPQGSRHCASRQQPSQATEAAPQAGLGSCQTVGIQSLSGLCPNGAFGITQGTHPSLAAHHALRFPLRDSGRSSSHPTSTTCPIPFA